MLCAEYEQEATGISPLAGNSGGITDPSGTVITRPESAHMGTEVAGGGELGGADGAHTAAFVERIDPDVPSGSGGAESQLSSGASIELHNGEGAHPSSVSVDGVTMATWDSTTTRSKHKSKVCVRDGDETNGCGCGRSLGYVTDVCMTDQSICCTVPEAYLVGPINRLGHGPSEGQ